MIASPLFFLVVPRDFVWCISTQTQHPTRREQDCDALRRTKDPSSLVGATIRVTAPGMRPTSHVRPRRGPVKLQQLATGPLTNPGVQNCSESLHGSTRDVAHISTASCRRFVLTALFIPSDAVLAAAMHTNKIPTLTATSNHGSGPVGSESLDSTWVPRAPGMYSLLYFKAGEARDDIRPQPTPHRLGGHNADSSTAMI